MKLTVELASGGSRGEAQGAHPPYPFLRTNQKKLFWRPGPHLSKLGLDDRGPPTPRLKTFSLYA